VHIVSTLLLLAQRFCARLSGGYRGFHFPVHILQTMHDANLCLLVAAAMAQRAWHAAGPEAMPRYVPPLTVLLMASVLSKPLAPSDFSRALTVIEFGA